MTFDLAERALQVAINIRQPKIEALKDDLVDCRASMKFVGAYLDDAVAARFFGSLKNEWLVNIIHLTREMMKMDVEEYISYYNHERLHTTLVI